MAMVPALLLLPIRLLLVLLLLHLLHDRLLARSVFLCRAFEILSKLNVLVSELPIQM